VATGQKRLSKTDRRQQLLETAQGIVSEAGTDALTLQTLAERAGVTKPIAYEHFGSRDGALIALYRRLDDEQINAARDALAQAPATLDAVCDIVAASYIDCCVKVGPAFGAISAALEGSEEMTRRAAATAEHESIQNIHFQTMNLFDNNLQLPTEADAALIDPPRDGAYEVVKKFVEAKKLQTIIYVSCDPATFARDAQILVAGGYQLAKLSLLDMFPQTLHSESVAMFIKNKND